MDLAKIRKKAKQKIVKDKKEVAQKEKEEKSVEENHPEGLQEKVKEKAEEKNVKDEVKIETPPNVEEKINEKKEETSKEQRIEKLLIFTVGKNRYAIPIDLLSQIIDDRELTIVPFLPNFLKGVFSLRGRIVGVIDVGERLNVQPSPLYTLKKIVVLEDRGDLFGLRVDSIDHVVEINLNLLEMIEEGVGENSQEFVIGVFHYKNKTVALLNLKKFLEFEIDRSIR